MLKNKKLVLSSIAIVLLLVVSSIFVNFTLANNDSSPSGDAGSGSSTGLTGYSNIDRAIMNSNSSNLQKEGNDKFKVVQIVADAHQSIVDAEAALNSTIAATAGEMTADQIQNDKNYAGTSYLWRYVYVGEYFRTAVFDQYRTIEQKMAEGAVQLTTVTTGELNAMDSDAQAILDSADFVYIWTDSASDFGGSSPNSKISQKLYNWLDNYATADSKPIGICWKTLGYDDPSNIKGNNTDQNMMALAYKLITKNKDSRYDNVLVTESDFFEQAYKQGGGSDSGNTETSYSIYKFIADAKDSYNGLGYFEWNRNMTLTQFAKREEVDGKQSFYLRVTTDPTYGLPGNTTDRLKSGDWDFDNARILIISDDDNAMTSGVGSAIDTLRDNTEAMSGVYTLDDATGVWTYSKSAAKSSLTTNLYADGIRGVPSNADIYYISAANLSKAYDDLSGDSEATYKLGYSAANTYYMSSVETTSVLGSITLSDSLMSSIPDGETSEIGADKICVRLAAKSKDDTTNTWYLTDETSPLTYVAATDGGTDDEGNTYDGVPAHYTYEFKNLNKADYDYAVIVDGSDVVQVDSSGTTPAYTNATNKVAVAPTFGNGTGIYNYYIYTDIDDTNQAFDEGGYIKRTDDGATDMTVVNTVADFYDNAKLAATDNTTGFICSTDTHTFTYEVSLAEEKDVLNYVTEKRNTYNSEQIAERRCNSIDFTDYDFVFIDDGDYLEDFTKSDGTAGTKYEKINAGMYNDMMSAVSGGTYFIVSDKAAVTPADDTDSDDGSGEKTVYAKKVADVINAGTYRNGADNKFKVLEIQPDYPIDTDLAEREQSSLGKGKGTVYDKYGSTGNSTMGNYYTSGSDMIEGKAKEEIAENAEYYDFDLTKAKIAYALKDQGVKYSDIELTQVSTEALIGMTEDIATTYDLVYVGGDISAIDVSIDEIYSMWNFNGDGAKVMGYVIPTFIMYTHTGTLTPTSTQYMSGAMKESNDWSTVVYMPENGNDLTKSKYDELIEYVNAGKPIIFSDEITEVYDKMNGSTTAGGLTYVQKLAGYWVNNGKIEKKNYYLDPSSRMYDLLEAASEKKDSSSVVWGYDPSVTKVVDNTDGDYGNTLYAYLGMGTKGVSILTADMDTLLVNYDEAKGTADYYNNGVGGATTPVSGIMKTYAMVPGTSWKSGSGVDQAKLIADCVKNSAGRTRIIMTSQPTEYQQGVESTYLTSTSLGYSFEVRTKAEDEYTYTLYVDKDRNTVFDTDDYYVTGSLTSGGASGGYFTYTATVKLDLPDDFNGSVSWYLEVKGKDKTVVADQTGLSKITNITTGKAEVNVLQIQTNHGTSNAENVTDTLYFDIESQWSHQIQYYNGYIPQNGTLSTDKAAGNQSAVLGRHENRFGIVEYDTNSGDDDWLSNLADALDGDYDISLDIATAESSYTAFSYTNKSGGTSTGNYQSIETWVSEAETLDKGGTVGGKTQAQWGTAVESYSTAYSAAQKTAASAKSDIDEYLEEAIEYLKYLKDSNEKYTIDEPAQMMPKDIVDSDGTVHSYEGGYYSSQKDYELAEKITQYYYTYVKDNYKDGDTSDVFDLLWDYYKLIKITGIGRNSFTDYDGVFGGSSDYTKAIADAKYIMDNYMLTDKYKEYLAEQSKINAWVEKFGKWTDSNGGKLVSQMFDRRISIDDAIELLEHCIDTGDYYMIFLNYYQENGNNCGTTDQSLKQTYSGCNFADLFIAYRDAKDAELDAKDNYDMALRRSYGSEFLKNMYSIIVLGPSSAFSPYGNGNGAADLSETAAKYLKEYISAGGDLLLFHDTMSPYSAGNGGSYNITSTLLEAVGMNRYHVDLTNQANSYTKASDGTYEYKSEDSELYYLTPYGFNDTLSQTSGIKSSVAKTQTEAKSYGVSQSDQINAIIYDKTQISAVSMTYLYSVISQSSVNKTKYLYASMDVNGALRTTTNAPTNGKKSYDYSQTSRAQQLNEGLVTMYPFNIGSTLNISGTHMQAYALDLESSKTTVWYTLSGSNGGNSTYYSADPYDAMESYFIYSSAYGTGTVTYCGAGHMSLTGTGSQNNDERKLFINVIINSSIAAKEAPTIKLYEPDEKYETELSKNTPATTDGGYPVYSMSVEAKTDSPDFDLQVKIPDDEKITKVLVYYDLDYFNSSGKVDYKGKPTYDSSTDKLVEQYTSIKEVKTTTKQEVASKKWVGNHLSGHYEYTYKDVTEDKIVETNLAELKGSYQEAVRNALATDKKLNGEAYGRDVKLKLDESYFAPYGGGYTFLVVEVFYGDKGESTYAIIKINASDPLFDLTENTIDNIDISVDTDYLTESRYVVG